MKFYHGSKASNIEMLLTQHSGDGFVYVTSSYLVALCYASRYVLNMFHFDKTKNKVIFQEVKPNYFQELTLNKEAYIYELEQKDYQEVAQAYNVCAHPHCYKTSENVRVVNKKHIKNLFEEFIPFIESGELEIKKYESLSPVQQKQLKENIRFAFKNKLEKHNFNNKEEEKYLLDIISWCYLSL